jgi:hypothetical protein
MNTITLRPATHLRRTGRFLRHLAEMTVAMVIGMIGYAVLVGGLLSAAGSSLEAARIAQPELFALGMASSMTVPMVAWMRRRGHGWRSSAEMSAAMFVPALALIGCYRLHAVAAGSICPLACAAMIPAMIVAMLYRFDEYTGHRHAAAAAG